MCEIYFLGYNEPMNRYTKAFTRSILVTILICLVVYINVQAGSITSPGGAPSTTSYTLTDIFNRLTTNAVAVLGGHSLSPTTTPQSSFHSLIDIYNAIPTIDATKVLTGTTYLGVVGTAVGTVAPATTTLLKTGQTTCYDDDGITIPCSGTGQDGEYQYGAARSYTDNHNGTVTDNSTGLMWTQCTYGLSSADWNASDCLTGSATTMTWATALSNCEGLTFAGKSDWKLPNINELASLTDYSHDNPAIDQAYFPNTQSGVYFSSTIFLATKEDVWTIETWDGDTDWNSGSLLTRCVRVEASPASSAQAQTLKTGQIICYHDDLLLPNYAIPCAGTGQDGQYQSGTDLSYTDNLDQTISDNATGLMWQKCPFEKIGQYCEDFDPNTPSIVTWTDDVDFCNSSTTVAGYSDWRLPNINELKSLRDYSRGYEYFGTNTSMDAKLFPFSEDYDFTTATTMHSLPDHDWYVDGLHLIVSGRDKSFGGFGFRCVRNDS